MLRMDQVHVIRHKVLVEGKSVRSVAKEMGVSRNTVAKYLKNPEPMRRRVARKQKRAPVMELLALGEHLEDRRGQSRSVAVPEALSSYRVESANATDYDWLLGGNGGGA